MSRKSRAKPQSLFRYFNSSPEVIRLVVVMYVKYPLSLRNVEDLLAERGIDICHETARFWWNRFGPMFAAEIRRKRVDTCGGTVKLSGLRLGGAGVVRYLSRMTTPRDPLYAGYRYPAELISYAAWLYFRFPLSLRMVEVMLAARGISVTYETIRQ